MRLNVTPAERDDICLALRAWIGELEEPLPKPRSALARRRRQRAARLEGLQGRIYMADVLPMPDVP